MEITEMNNIVESLKGNAGAGLLLVAYYLIIYGRNIIEGLGLNKRSTNSITQLKRRLEIVAMKIALAKQKKESGLSSEEINNIEAETMAQFHPDVDTKFTGIQRYIAIPLLILMTILSIAEIQSLQDASGTEAFHVIIGYVFICLIIIVGFWGLQHLKVVKSAKLATLGFMVYWSFGIYIVIFIGAALVEAITDIPLTSENQAGVMFLFAIIVSVILGLIKKLPGMPESVPVKNE